MAAHPVVRFIEQVWNRGELEAADGLIASDFVAHGASGPIRGPEAVKAVVAEWRTAFPDLRYELDDWIVDGEVVATRWHFDATHLGTVADVQPTGRRVRHAGTTLWRLDGERIAEAWSNDEPDDLIAGLKENQTEAGASV